MARGHQESDRGGLGWPGGCQELPRWPGGARSRMEGVWGGQVAARCCQGGQGAPGVKLRGLGWPGGSQVMPRWPGGARSQRERGLVPSEAIRSRIVRSSGGQVASRGPRVSRSQKEVV